MAEDPEITTVVYDDSDTEENRLGCRRLACAVIGQAISDMTYHSTTLEPGRERERDKDAALAFLVSTSYEWARQRSFWASLADMDPDVLAERSRGLIR